MREDLKALLRGARLRATAGRVAALEALEDLAHADAAQVHDALVQRVPTTSVQSVYNILNDITRVGLARRIEPAGSPALFERRVGDNHHHLICRRCYRIEDVDCVADTTPCLHPVDDHGFVVDEAEVVFWGVCPLCQEVAPADATR